MSDLTLNVIKAIKDRQSFEKVLIDVAKAFAACDFFKWANWKTTVESTFCAQEAQTNFSQTLNVTEVVGLLASDWASEFEQILNGTFTDYIEQIDYESICNEIDMEFRKVEGNRGTGSGQEIEVPCVLTKLICPEELPRLAFADARSTVEVCNELNGGTEMVTEELLMTKHVDLNPQTRIRCMSSVQDSSNILSSSFSKAADTVISLSSIPFADATSTAEVCNELNGGTKTVTEELRVDLNPQTRIRCMSSVQDSSNILPNAADTLISLCNIPIAQDREVDHELNIDINEVEHEKSDKHKFACDICGKKFSTKTLVKRHIKQMHKQRHNSVANQNCVSIPTTTLQQTEYHHTVITQHLKRSSGEQLYVCGDCQKGFRWPSQLKCHQMTHFDEKPFACGDCQKRFNHRGTLKIHQRIHSGEKKYVCPICSKAFFYLGNLKIHERVHSGEKPYVCGDCQKRFSQSHSLKTHQRIHSGEKKYVCPICSKAFFYLGNLKIHERVHSGEKPYVCGDCQKRFSQSNSLKTHQRIHSFIHERVHSGEKPYVCGDCQKRFSQSHSLKTHQRIHSGEKKYVCPICSKAFLNRGNLKIHERIHRGEKPYVCGDCQKRFSQKHSLKTHQRIHSGEKPYVCGD